jgi:hypothetical protein
MRHAAILEKVIKYIPVADDTLGGTPMLNRRGLKMTPPPRPSAPATHPPPNPRHRTFLSTLPSKTRSDGTKLISPYFFLSAYSPAVSLTEMSTIMIISIIKTAVDDQSAILHFAKPSADPLK